MKKLLLSITLGVFLLLTGCHRPDDGQMRAYLVKEVKVTSQSSDVTVHRYYNTSPKMQLILLYIRSVSSRLQPEVDPETVPGRLVQITTVNADSSQKEYLQKNDRYFLSDGQWRLINPEQGAKLWQLLLTIPSDPEP